MVLEISINLKKINDKLNIYYLLFDNLLFTNNFIIIIIF